MYSVVTESKVSLEEVEDIETVLQLDDEIEVMIISDENEMGQVRINEQMEFALLVVLESPARFLSLLVPPSIARDEGDAIE